MIKFGPSGPGERFYNEGFKSSEQAALWTKNQGLDLFEYSFGRGVNLGQEKAISLNNAFSAAGIKISVHAPYYINFANPDDEKAKNSFNYIVESALMARCMGAERIIFHPGSQGKESREITTRRTYERIAKLADIIHSEKLDDMYYCPETMGKIAQIGTIEEVVEFCSVDDIFIPTIDFGHVNARECGSLNTVDDFVSRMRYMIDKLGFDRVKHFHVHFSKIQYSSKGEIKHLNFDDEGFGPEYQPFIDACILLKLEPEVICESAGHQADDAKTMKDYYLSKISL